MSNNQEGRARMPGFASSVTPTIYTEDERQTKSIKLANLPQFRWGRRPVAGAEAWGFRGSGNGRIGAKQQLYLPLLRHNQHLAETPTGSEWLLPRSWERRFKQKKLLSINRLLTKRARYSN